MFASRFLRLRAFLPSFLPSFLPQRYISSLCLVWVAKKDVFDAMTDEERRALAIIPGEEGHEEYV